MRRPRKPVNLRDKAVVKSYNKIDDCDGSVDEFDITGLLVEYGIIKKEKGSDCNYETLKPEFFYSEEDFKEFKETGQVPISGHDGGGWKHWVCRCTVGSGCNPVTAGQCSLGGNCTACTGMYIGPGSQIVKRLRAMEAEYGF